MQGIATTLLSILTHPTKTTPRPARASRSAAGMCTASTKTCSRHLRHRATSRHHNPKVQDRSRGCKDLDLSNQHGEARLPYNIVQKALFNNVLVALPTGSRQDLHRRRRHPQLFRWFPDGKIVFLAPTKPLVDQQKTACHRICGLPWDCAIDLTATPTPSAALTTGAQSESST